MRGTGHLLSSQAPCIRFIPAHAGNSIHPAQRACMPPVHPRACGEQLAGIGAWHIAHGSSPRMRGTGFGLGVRHLLRRFIPAHAGNRRSKAALWPISTVHPRACGEQSELHRVSRLVCGSSPRMRGTGHRTQPRECLTRFIPAHAGNRRRLAARQARTAVHPRACGEQRCSGRKRSKWRGSSPRMRGTAGQERPQPSAQRFIPAHAGNRRQQGCRPPEGSVHPRACGEQLACHVRHHANHGSSPRMRGTDQQVFPRDFGGRFIPAHAGNSSTDCGA